MWPASARLTSFYPFAEPHTSSTQLWERGWLISICRGSTPGGVSRPQLGAAVRLVDAGSESSFNCWRSTCSTAGEVLGELRSFLSLVVAARKACTPPSGVRVVAQHRRQRAGRKARL
eukprot:42759-Rhodomonas_salina.1